MPTSSTVNTLYAWPLVAVTELDMSRSTRGVLATAELLVQYCCNGRPNKQTNKHMRDKTISPFIAEA